MRRFRLPLGRGGPIRPVTTQFTVMPSAASRLFESRLKIYPNNAKAVLHLAESPAVRPIGCTQPMEIISLNLA